VPHGAHVSQPWRIHALAPDFDIEDVWALPTPGGPDDFTTLVTRAWGGRPEDGSPSLVRFIWAARWKLGTWFGWDDAQSGLGQRVSSLAERLPTDLSDGPKGPHRATSLFTPLYLTDNEWAAEIANKTMHGVLHLGWVADGQGGYRGQMAVLVKPNGRWGRVYMAIIKPFRYALIYPALIRGVERRWHEVTTRGG
jgi:hypothetical protein